MGPFFDVTVAEIVLEGGPRKVKGPFMTMVELATCQRFWAASLCQGWLELASGGPESEIGIGGTIGPFRADLLLKVGWNKVPGKPKVYS